jgi:hypothetical protein
MKDGLIVLKGGAVLYEYTAVQTLSLYPCNISDPQTRHRLFCGILEATKKLKVDDLVSTYVPAEKSVYEKVTLRQVLGMRAVVIHDASTDYRKPRDSILLNLTSSCQAFMKILP